MLFAAMSSSGLTSRRSRIALGLGEDARAGEGSVCPARSRGIVATPRPEVRGPKGIQDGEGGIA